ncbi:MAG: Glutamate/gamma-aminobutyrate antiporter [Chlamydiae bacterium]|nr:Glutamate/gamma-aminobutyrate antiporter [Chlamydiota bacterium]
MVSEKQAAKPRRVISVFVLAMLNVAIMASLRNLPLVASYGLSALFFFFIVAVFFLIPSALVSAELATGWPKGGGLYIWVREALGDRWGFFAIWMQWVHNVAWYPVILSFVATTLAYVINPALAENKLFIIAIILISFWGMTWSNYLGIKTSSWFSTIGVILGTIIPGLFIISLGIIWLSGGQPIHTTLSWNALIPDLSSINNVVFLAGLFLAFMGLEVSSAHAADVRDPQKNYPRAIILAAIITFSVFTLGALAIAFVVPDEKLSLVAGLMEAFSQFFSYYRLQWALPIVAILLVIGAVAEVNAWIVGPVRGLYATCVHGNLPPIFQKQNKHGVPTNLLLFQAIIVSITSLAILELPTVSAFFWILSAMSAQIYLVAYVLMFISAIRLRYTRPHVPRAYKVPYKSKGMWTMSMLGLTASCFAIVISFFPPSQIDVGNIFFYETFLISSFLIMSAIPLIIYKLRKPHWIKEIIHHK